MGSDDEDDGRPLVHSEQCETCIFRTGTKMVLRPGRLRSLINDTLAGGGVIPCHETASHGDDDDEDGCLTSSTRDPVCRGFYDKFGHLSNLIRITNRFGGYREVPPPKDWLAKQRGTQPETEQAAHGAGGARQGGRGGDGAERPTSVR